MGCSNLKESNSCIHDEDWTPTEVSLCQKSNIILRGCNHIMYKLKQPHIEPKNKWKIVCFGLQGEMQNKYEETQFTFFFF